MMKKICAFGTMLCLLFINKLPAVNRGLVNQGNSCYMNASIQCITNIESLISYIKLHKAKFTQDKNVKLITFFELLEEIKKNENNAYSPQNFYDKNYVGQRGTQQDAPDFFRPFLELFIDRDQAIQKQFFNGTTISSLRCTSCNYTREEKNPFTTLPLPLGFWTGQQIRINYTELSQCLTHFTSLEHIQDWKCESCNHLGGTKSISIGSAPNIFIITLNRFDFNLKTFNTERLYTEIKFPLKFDLSQYLNQNAPNKENAQYNLIGIIIKTGGLEGGHYYAYCKDFSSQQWFRFDDSSVSSAQNAIDRICEQTLEPGLPYILFYERTAAPTVIQPAPVKPKPGPALQPKPTPVKPSIITQPKPAPVKPKPSTVAEPEIKVIHEELAIQLSTLQTSLEEKQALLESINYNFQSYSAKTIDGKSPLHLFVDFLTGIFQNESNIELIQNQKPSSAEEFFGSNPNIDQIKQDIQPQNYFAYLKYLLNNFDPNAQMPNSLDTVLHKLLKNSNLQTDMNKNPEDFNFLNLIICIMKAPNINLNLQDKDGKTPFYLLVERLNNANGAMWQGLIQSVFLTYPVHIDSPTYNQQNILHCLLNRDPIIIQTQSGHMANITDSLVKLFLENSRTENFSNATPNVKKGLGELIVSQDKYGKTPLHYALLKNHIDATNNLLEFIFENNQAQDSLFNLTSKAIGGDPGKTIRELIEAKGLNQYIENLRIMYHQPEEISYSKKIFDQTIDSFLKHTNPKLPQTIKNLATEGTLAKIEKAVEKEVSAAETSKKPLDQKQVIELITQKIIQTISASIDVKNPLIEDPLTQKLRNLKQSLEKLKEKLSDLTKALGKLKSKL